MDQQLASLLDQGFRDAGIPRRVLSADVAGRVKTAVDRAYTPRLRRLGMCEVLDQPHESVNLAEGWKLLCTCVGAQPCLLVFDPLDLDEVFEFTSGGELERLLSETPHFDVFVTDRPASFLLVFDHEDNLVGYGTAADWVRGTAGVGGERSTPPPLSPPPAR